MEVPRRRHEVVPVTASHCRFPNRSREEARELRELLNPNAPVDSPGDAEAKRRAAAERAMRLQFVQGIKKKGMTDFEMSMIQESRKGGRSPGRRR